MLSLLTISDCPESLSYKPDTVVHYSFMLPSFSHLCHCKNFMYFAYKKRIQIKYPDYYIEIFYYIKTNTGILR